MTDQYAIELNRLTAALETVTRERDAARQDAGWERNRAACADRIYEQLSKILGAAPEDTLTVVASDRMDEIKSYEEENAELRSRAEAAEARAVRAEKVVEAQAEYIIATECWAIEPHDDKERKAHLRKIEALRATLPKGAL